MSNGSSPSVTSPQDRPSKTNEARVRKVSARPSGWPSRGRAGDALLGEEEEADDDGCYPPRINDEPRAPNPHKICRSIQRSTRLEDL